MRSLLHLLVVISLLLSNSTSFVVLHPQYTRRAHVVNLSVESRPGYVTPPPGSKRRPIATKSPPSSRLSPPKANNKRKPSPSRAAGSKAQPEKEDGEWAQVFDHLQSLPNRSLSDYESALTSCQLMGRPFECLSLIRYMTKDGIPRPIRFYEETVKLAYKLEKWNTIIDTIIIFERKEEFDPTCPSILKILLLALEACEHLGKGSRAARVFERCKQLNDPAFKEGPAAATVVKACLLAGTHDIGIPYARLVLKLGLPNAKPSDLAILNMAITTLAKGGCNAEAMAAFEHIRHLGGTPGVEFYGAMLDGLINEGDLEGALSLFDSMTKQQQNNIEPNLTMLNNLIQACCRAGQLEKGLELYRSVPVKERDLHRAHPLWTLATREGNIPVIEWLLKDLAQVDGLLGLVCYHASMCNLARLGYWQLAEELANTMIAKGQSPTPMTFYALVAACEKANEHERLLNWFQQMLQSKVEPDILRHGMALKSCEQLGRWQTGLALMTNMRDRGLEMDPQLWKRLFLLLGREARGQEAIDLLQEMEDREERLEPICYEAAVTAFSRMGDKNQAVRQMIAFEDKGIAMGRGAYTSAIASCRDTKDWETAWKLYKRMKERSHEVPSTLTRAALVAVLVAAQRYEEALQIAQEQAEAGEEPPLHMRANLVLVYAAQEDFEKVLHYFRPIWDSRLVHGNNKGQVTSWSCCNAALQACAKVGDYELALQVLKTMKENKVMVDVVMYGCVLTACSVAGAWREALALLKEMESSQELRPNLVCYTSVITALQKGEEWRKALNLLLKMLNSGPAPDVQTYNAVISACANAGEAHMALKIFHAMKVQNVAPNEVTYATAIVACWRVDDWRRAMEILSNMKADGFKPNMITVSLVIDACDRNKKFDLAAYVFEEGVVGNIKSEDYDMESSGPGMLVDLHGYCQPVARAALRAGLKRLSQMYINAGRNKEMVKDFVFITGVGRHSAMPFEPVLRPAMQEMLTNDFDPPLPCQSVEGNWGRMVVKAKDLVNWLEAQTDSGRKLTPAELHSSTFKLKSATDLKKNFENLLNSDRSLSELQQEEEEQEEEKRRGKMGDQ